MTTAFMTALAEGLLAGNRNDEALTVIDNAIKLIEINGDFYIMPEALRVKGNILEELLPADLTRAENIYLQSIALADERAALGWKLRAATSLGKLYQKQGRRDRCVTLLTPVYQTFNEGFETFDLVAANHLLEP
jgi:hypothetical protein